MDSERGEVSSKMRLNLNTNWVYLPRHTRWEGYIGRVIYRFGFLKIGFGRGLDGPEAVICC